MWTCRRHGLGLLNPMLRNVVAVKQGGRIMVTGTPEGMALPAERVAVRVAPMQLTLGRGEILDKVLGVVNLKDRSALALLLPSACPCCVASDAF